MSHNSQWKSGFLDGIPICLGYFAVSFTFGIKAGTLGLTAFQAFFMSICNVTSAGQFAGLDMIAYGASFLEVALAQFVINIRYCLMSCSLSQKFRPGMPFYHRLLVGYGVTDEIFGVCASRKGSLEPAYPYGVMGSAIPGWAFGTLFGVLFGSLMPDMVLSALGIAVYGMFLAIILPEAKHDRVVAGIVLFSMAASLLSAYVPGLKNMSSGFQIIIITIVAAGAAAVFFPVKEPGAAGAGLPGKDVPDGK